MVDHQRDEYVSSAKPRIDSDDHIVLDLAVVEGDHIEGTARLETMHEPSSFSGWLELMRVVEELQSIGHNQPDTP